jgi:RNA polymerase sigma-70 factor (ECF subfamily)
VLANSLTDSLQFQSTAARSVNRSGDRGRNLAAILAASRHQTALDSLLATALPAPADFPALALESPLRMGNLARTKSELQAQQRQEDTELIREAQSGSEPGARAAFDSLVRRYDQAVIRLAMHITGSEQDAQDIHQEAFIKAYKHLNNFRFECSFYTWMYRIVTNLCLDHLRRRKSRREDPAVIVDSNGDEMDLLSSVSDNRAMANPEREFERKHLGEKIAGALDDLTPRERMVFELKHYQGLKLRTIGEMLNTSEETAKNTLFRATRKLRTRLQDLR